MFHSLGPSSCPSAVEKEENEALEAQEAQAEGEISATRLFASRLNIPCGRGCDGVAAAGLFDVDLSGTLYVYVRGPEDGRRQWLVGCVPLRLP